MPGQLGDSALTMLLDAAIEEENIEVGLQVSELQADDKVSRLECRNELQDRERSLFILGLVSVKTLSGPRAAVRKG